MNETLEQRLACAFDGLHAPQAVRESALAAIEAARSVPAPAPSAPPVRVVPSPKRSARRRPRRAKALLAAAACLVTAAIGFGGYQFYEQPVAYVGIDVNPSVELSVNRFDRVVGARAVNEDGAVVLAEVNLAGCTYDQALCRLMDSPALSTYLAEDAVVEISVTSDDQRVSDQLMRTSDDALAQHRCHGSASRADEGTRQAAAAAGMGTARYQAACELMALDPDATLEGCASLSMRELRDSIAAHHGSSAAGDGDAVSGYGGPSGQGSHQGRGRGPKDGSGHGAAHGAHVHGPDCGHV